MIAARCGGSRSVVKPCDDGVDSPVIANDLAESSSRKPEGQDNATTSKHGIGEEFARFYAS